MSDKTEEYKTELLKPYNYDKKKLNKILTKMTDEEKEIVLKDPTIIKYICNISNYDILNMVFRLVPASIQELIWSNSTCQKLLLGYGHTPDFVIFDKIQQKKFYHEKNLPKKEQKGDFYFSKEKVRIVELLIKGIKSPKILEELPHNIYYQIIIANGKKLPDILFSRINVEELYNNITNSEFYSYLSIPERRRLVYIVNCYTNKILLPQDFKELFAETNMPYNPYYRQHNLAQLIYQKQRTDILKREKLIIDIATLRKLNIYELIELLSFPDEKIDKEILNKYFSQMLDEAISSHRIFSSGFISFNALENKTIQNIFIDVAKKMLNNKEEQYFLDTIFAVLFKNAYDEDTKKSIYNLLKNSILNIDNDSLVNIFFQPNDTKSLFYLRFNVSSRHMDYLHNISTDVLLKINVKHVNKIASFLKNKDQDEISDSYSKAIRLYCVFGLDHSLAILNGEYGYVSKTFLDSVSKLNLSNITFTQLGKKYQPVLNEGLINFLFTGTNITNLFKADSVFEKYWYELYNNYEEVKRMCKDHITIGKLEIILKEIANRVNFSLTPDNYRLGEVLKEVELGNKTEFANEKIYEETLQIYEQQKERKLSTIPYVKGTSNNGYIYEMMCLDDPIAYVLGYRADCCIRVKDIAHNHLLHALLSENGRILLIKNPENRIVAFSPLKRNGEYLIANSIEVIEKAHQAEIASSFKEGMGKILTISSQNETTKSLKIALIGHNSNLLPEDTTPWPKALKTPTIAEKRDPQYSNTDCYHHELDIVTMISNKKLSELQSGKIEPQYTDPRPKIKCCSTDNNDANHYQIIKMVNAIHYTNLKKSHSENLFYTKESIFTKYIFCNVDWYILVGQNYQIEQEVLGDNKRALEEMKIVLTLLSKRPSKEEMESYILKLTNPNQN